MKFSEIGAKVQVLTGMTAGNIGGYTSAQLSAAINDANLDVNIDTLALEGIGEVYTVSGTASYALSATYMCPDLLAIRAVYWGTTRLEQKAPDDKIWSDSTSVGCLKYFRIWNNKIELKTTPDSVDALNVYYYKKPTYTTADGDSYPPEIPSEYHMGIAYLAAAYLSVKNNEDIKINKYFQFYNQRIGRLHKIRMNYNQYEIPVDFDRRHSY